MRPWNSMLSTETAEWSEIPILIWAVKLLQSSSCLPVLLFCWLLIDMQILFKLQDSRRQWGAVTDLSRGLLGLPKSCWEWIPKALHITFIFFSSVCLPKKHLPSLALCHMEEVLFSLYHLKLINCPQARAASLESPFFFFCSWLWNSNFVVLARY